MIESRLRSPRAGDGLQSTGPLHLICSNPSFHFLQRKKLPEGSFSLCLVNTIDAIDLCLSLWFRRKSQHSLFECFNILMESSDPSLKSQSCRAYPKDDRPGVFAYPWEPRPWRSSRGRRTAGSHVFAQTSRYPLSPG